MTDAKSKSSNIVQGLYYYLTLSGLLASFFTAIYWQTESEQAVFEVTTKEVVLDTDKRDFVVEVNFCSPSKKELKISRYYENVDTQVMYHTPEGTYPTAGGGCFKTKLSAYTGRLEPGNYKYHVIVAYDLNPLRKIEKEVSTVNVTIK
jgi:hypothetical protein